jgi:hypothetical protein
MRRESLNITADRDLLRWLLAAGRAFDLDRGGLYDARSGVVNVWASPDDKPACWDRPITRGALRYPREYAGALGWDWRDDDRADLSVEAARRPPQAPAPDGTVRVGARRLAAREDAGPGPPAPGQDFNGWVVHPGRRAR